MKDMKRLFGYMGPYKKDMILGALFVMIETGFELFIPIMISNLIDIGVANHDVNYIYVKGVQMALLALGALVTGLLYAHFSAKASYGWGAEIRKAEYARVQQYAFSNLDHFVTSSLITRMTTDVNVLQNMIIFRLFRLRFHLFVFEVVVAVFVRSRTLPPNPSCCRSSHRRRCAASDRKSVV